MVLVDTSVWISHLREADANLQSLLLAEEVVCHPFVTGELACGNLGNREEILELLQRRPALAGLHALFAVVNWYRHHLDELKTIASDQTKR